MSEFIEDVQVRIAAALQRLGISDDVARLVGNEITSGLAQTWHSKEVYIGKAAVERARTREDVLRRFNGRNAREVAREMGIGRATVYRIIKTAGR